MSKRNKIIYWVFTVWLALGMLSSAIVQLMKVKEEVEKFTSLGYPIYLLNLLAIWKILGLIVLFVPRYPLLKEWAYAGFFFAMSGAAYSHIAMGHGLGDTVPSLLLLVLTVISWYFRPASRKLAPANPAK